MRADPGSLRWCLALSRQRPTASAAPTAEKAAATAATNLETVASHDHPLRLLSDPLPAPTTTTQPRKRTTTRITQIVPPLCIVTLPRRATSTACVASSGSSSCRRLGRRREPSKPFAAGSHLAIFIIAVTFGAAAFLVDTVGASDSSASSSSSSSSLGSSSSANSASQSGK